MKFEYLSQPLACFRIGGLSTARNRWRCFIETRDILRKRVAFFPLSIQDTQRRYASAFLKEYRLGFLRDYLWQRSLRAGGEAFAAAFLCGRGKACYAIWGSGCIGKQCLQWFGGQETQIACIVDSDVHKQGSSIRGIPVCAPESLTHSMFILIASSTYCKEISVQLAMLGFQEGVEYISFRQYQDRWIAAYLNTCLPKCSAKSLR